MPYSSDSDLIKVQQDIMDLSVPDWADQHIEAERVINRDVETKWYRPVSSDIGVTAIFNPALIIATDLTMLSVFKALELAYLFMVHNTTDEHFIKKMELFRLRYETELESIISNGLVYDWLGNGDTSQPIYSANQSRFRRLVR